MPSRPSRRNFLKTTTAATAASTLGFPLIAKGKAEHTLRMASLAPEGSSWALAFNSMKHEVKKRTEGAVVIRTYYGGTMGDEPAMIRKIRTGQLDAAAVTNVGLGDIDKQLLMLQLPMLFKNYDELDRVRAAMSAKFAIMLDKAGFRLGGWGDVGFSYCDQK
jgi:TRAP-type C4-dicarboxylate transport system substrate-binding protein